MTEPENVSKRNNLLRRALCNKVLNSKQDLLSEASINGSRVLGLQWLICHSCYEGRRYVFESRDLKSRSHEAKLEQTFRHFYCLLQRKARWNDCNQSRIFGLGLHQELQLALLRSHHLSFFTIRWVDPELKPVLANFASTTPHKYGVLCTWQLFWCWPVKLILATWCIFSFDWRTWCRRSKYVCRNCRLISVDQLVSHYRNLMADNAVHLHSFPLTKYCFVTVDVHNTC